MSAATRRSEHDAPSSAFALAWCQPGMELALKAQVAAVRPDLHPGFQRRGFVTFKCTGPPFSPDEVPDVPLARGWACSAGTLSDLGAVNELIERVGATAVRAGPRDKPAAPPFALPLLDAPLVTGAVVVDLTLADGEPIVAGWHVHRAARPDGACGRWLLPEGHADAARLYEALRFSGAPLKGGDAVLLLGTPDAAPALLDRGAIVHVVHPDPLAPQLLGQHGLAQILATPLGVSADVLPRAITWIVLTESAPPDKLLVTLRRVVMHTGATLRGLLICVRYAENPATLPKLLTAIRGLGAHTVEARQLATNRHDLWIVARLPQTQRR